MPSGTDRPARADHPGRLRAQRRSAASRRVSGANGQVPFVQNATAGISNRAWNPESQLLLAGQSTPEQFVTNVQAEVRAGTEPMSTVDGLIGPGRLSTDDVEPPAPRPTRAMGRRSRNYGRKARWAGWLFALPALIMFAVFELYPVLTSIQYSFYDWDGIGPSPPGSGSTTTRRSSPTPAARLDRGTPSS